MSELLEQRIEAGHFCLPGPLGLRRAHKFEPRYSEAEPRNFDITGKWVHPDTVAQMIAAMKERTYHHDICVRCGKVIPAAPDNGGGERDG